MDSQGKEQEGEPPVRISWDNIERRVNWKEIAMRPRNNTWVAFSTDNDAWASYQSLVVPAYLPIRTIDKNGTALSVGCSQSLTVGQFEKLPQRRTSHPLGISPSWERARRSGKRE